MIGGGALGELIIRIGADATRLNRELNASGNRVDAFASQVTAAGTRIAAFGGIVAGAMLATAIKVDDAFDTIRIGTGRTGAALQNLQADFRAVAVSVPSSLADTATAISSLAQRTGRTGGSLQVLSTQLLNLSRITGTDLGANIRSSAQLFRDWRLAVEQQGAALDFLFRASQATGIGVDTLAASVVRFGAPLRQMGFSFQQAATLIAQFEREGVNADAVLGSLRRGLATFTEAGLSAPAALATVIARMKELGPGTEATALALKVFGARAGPEMAAAILEGRLEIEALQKQLQSSGETINAAAAETADFGEKMGELRNRAVLAFGALAEPALPAFTALATAAIGAVQGLADALNAMSPAARSAVVTLTLVTTAAGAALASIALLTRGLIALNAAMGLTAAARLLVNFAIMLTRIRSLSDAVLLLRVSFQTLQAAMGPVGWITLLVGALVGLGLAFRSTGRQARAAAAEATQAAADFRAALAGMDDAAASVAFVGTVAQRATLTQQIRNTERLLATQRAALDRLRAQGLRAPSGAQLQTGTASDAQVQFSRLEQAIGRNVRALANLNALARRTDEDMAAVGDELARRREAAASLLVPLAEVDLSALDDAEEKTQGWRAASEGVLKAVQDVGGILRRLKYPDARSLQSAAAAAGRIFRALTDFKEELTKGVHDFSERMGATLLDKLRQARGELKGLREEANKLSAGGTVLRQLETLLPGLAQSFVSAFSAVRQFREQRSQAGLPVPIGAPTPAAAALVVAMEVLRPAVDALAPAFSALTAPLNIFGRILGEALIPVFKALFPVVKFLAITFTYSGQVIGNVVGALAVVIGETVAAIGDLISRIPGLGQEGGAIERFGRGLSGFGDDMFDLAGAMVQARREIEGLSWEEALDRMAYAASNAAAALVNAVDGFKLARYRFDATAVQGPAPTPAPPPTGPQTPVGGPGRPGGGVPVAVTIPITFTGTGNPAADYRALYAQAERASLSDPAARAGFLATWPRPV